MVAGADQLSEPTGHEANTKAENQVDDALRLGCQTRVLGPGVVVNVINVFDAEAFA